MKATSGGTFMWSINVVRRSSGTILRLQPIEVSPTETMENDSHNLPNLVVHLERRMNWLTHKNGTVEQAISTTKFAAGVFAAVGD